MSRSTFGFALVMAAISLIPAALVTLYAVAL